nr:T9SS type A sorting domain-containing protein [Flavobacteriaceae bacterium]
PIIADGDNYEINIGNIKIHNGVGLAVEDVSQLEDALVISYPNSDEVWIQSTLTHDEAISFKLYNLQGQLLASQIMEEKVYRFNTAGLPKGMYLMQFEDGFGRIATKKVLVR